MSVEPIKRARGRPRDPAKRTALLDAARALFLRHGVDAVTVDQVIAEARVSRATYYGNFADRFELLVAVIARESERIVPAETEELLERVPLREALIAYGDRIMRFLADPDTVSLGPLILHVRNIQPELATSFFNAGPRRVWDVLERILQIGQTRGELRAIDTADAVNDLIGLWQGSWSTEILYGYRAPPDEQEVLQRSRHAVDFFLRANGAAS